MTKQVKRIKVTREVKSTGNTVREELSMIQDLDRNKNVVKEVHYSDEEEEQVTEMSYNEDGLLKKEEVHYLVDDMREKLEIEYTAAKKRAKETKSYNGEVQEIVLRDFDEKNNPVAARREDADGSLEERETFAYNEQGKLILYQKYNSDDEPVLKAELIYDANGDIQEENRWSEEDGETKVLYDIVVKDKTPDSTLFNKEGKIMVRIRHSYDDKQQLIKEVTESTKGGLQKWTQTYSYNDLGKTIEINVYDKSEALKKQTKYVYNEDNELVAELLFEEVPNSAMTQVKLSYEYEYFED
jgi:YD repeat-containing protein